MTSEASHAKRLRVRAATAPRAIETWKRATALGGQDRRRQGDPLEERSSFLFELLVDRLVQSFGFDFGSFRHELTSRMVSPRGGRMP
ncbi:MAG TPA: hypothetical protein VGG20_20905 [Thermoanaerobaculia bacterium]|jgi:hypothetical protein